MKKILMIVVGAMMLGACGNGGNTYQYTTEDGKHQYVLTYHKNAKHEIKMTDGDTAVSSIDQEDYDAYMSNAGLNTKKDIYIYSNYSYLAAEGGYEEAVKDFNENFGDDLLERTKKDNITAVAAIEDLGDNQYVSIGYIYAKDSDRYIIFYIIKDGGKESDFTKLIQEFMDNAVYEEVK